MAKKKVLFIGSTGRIGPGLLEEYEERYTEYYDIILGYHKTKPNKNYKSVKIDLSSIASLKKAMREIHTVINLAANAKPGAKFEDLIQPNIIGVYNILEAARLVKCKRVIQASSVHVIKGYPLNKIVKTNYAPKPSGFYAATKVFDEALCYVFSQKYNISALAIRIGAYVSNDARKVACVTRDNLDYVISQRDMAQLIHKSIMAPLSVKYGILSGTSDNKHKYMDLDATKKLIGYNPQDDAFEMCKHITK